MLLPSLYKMKKSWEELEQLIIERFGKNYSNYPASVEYFIKIMKDDFNFNLYCSIFYSI